MTALREQVDTTWQRFLGWLLGERRASRGLALMRIGMGAMTLVILALYLPNFSYSFGQASSWGEALTRHSSANDYLWPVSALFSREDPDWLLYLKTVVLMAAAAAYMLGWRMRIISPLFVALWLGFTTLNPVILNTGHYQTFRVFLLFMLLADTSRCWSLDARRRKNAGDDPRLSVAGRSLPAWVPVLTNNLAVILIGYQLCVIYLTSALWKLQGSTWTTGVAVYYPLRLEELTIFPWLSELIWHVTPAVYLASWASVYLQLLFPLALLNRWTRRVGLVLITGMHAGIGVLLALPWFSLMMILGDMIFIRENTWRAVTDWCGRKMPALLRRASSRRSGDGPAEPETVAAAPGSTVSA